MPWPSPVPKGPKSMPVLGVTSAHNCWWKAAVHSHDYVNSTICKDCQPVTKKHRMPHEENACKTKWAHGSAKA